MVERGLKYIAWYKAIVGIVAIILAVGALIYGEQNLNEIVFRLARQELQEDPTDFFFNAILPYLPLINPQSFWIFFWGTLAFGITHLVLGYEIHRARYWPLVWVFWALVLFLPFEFATLVAAFRFSKLSIFIINLLIVIYVYFYIRKYHKTFNVFKHLMKNEAGHKRD